MALLSPTFLSISSHNKYHNINSPYPNLNHYIHLKSYPKPLIIRKQCLRCSATSCPAPSRDTDLLSPLRSLAVSCVVVIFSLGVRVRLSSAASSPPLKPRALIYSQEVQDNEAKTPDAIIGNIGDEDLEAEFEKWKSKTYALTVPFRFVSVQGSVPPSWITDFVRSQGKRVKLHSEIRSNLAVIFSDLCTNISKGTSDPKSAVAADIVTIGDSWLNFAIKTSLVEPLQRVEDQDWFKGLSNKWKLYLRRNSHGNLDPKGDIWAAPYRWGTMVIAYKKNKFLRHNLTPVEDWADLWRPELAGKISMVDSPREIIGAVLKSMGASYNTTNMDAQVNGGRKSVQRKLAELEKQVRLFDSGYYLKAFQVGDVWVAVGWSSDVIPAAKRMNDVSVIVPKSGTSLWADLWAIPATSRLTTERMGGRVRGPSPLVHQWIEFCLQAARALPFRQEVVPGAPPSSLDGASIVEPKELTKGKPKLDTNLIAGVPPANILDQCEFLEPLSEDAFADYQWLIEGMQKAPCGLVERMWRPALSNFQGLARKMGLKSEGNLR